MRIFDYALLLCLVGCVVACTAELPASMDYEIKNQRKIAHTGFMQYQEFTQNNH